MVHSHGKWLLVILLPLCLQELIFPPSQVDGERTDTRKMSELHGLKLLVNSTKRIGTGEASRLELDNYPDITYDIIKNASVPMTALTGI
jgi:hypothetical protein